MGRDRSAEAFESWLQGVEPSLRRALIATYGPIDGREATVDALSWAWENWPKAQVLSNPTAYLYRVGQSAHRRFAVRQDPEPQPSNWNADFPEFDPALVPSLRGLPEQQRAVVVLVIGYQWRQSEVAETMGISPSTVHAHLERGLNRLREAMGSAHVGD